MTESNKQYHEWIRVHGPDLRPEYAEEAKKNKQILQNDQFKQACEQAGITPTKRQASKFKQKRGLAYMGRGK